MASNLLLVAPLPVASESRGDHARVPSPLSASDAADLATLWMRCCRPSITSGETLESATVDTEASFRGEYGAILSAATVGVWAGQELVAAVMTVERAPWPDVPDCPFVIELVVAPESRDRGPARAVLQAASEAATTSGADRIALRVDVDNAPALALYRHAGFVAS